MKFVKHLTRIKYVCIIYNIEVVKLVKKRDVERLLKHNGWWKLREGGNHEIWTDGKRMTQVVRHGEMNELTVKKGIIKKFGLKER